MTSSPKQPRKDDAVLGGQAPIVGGFVLGGVDGVLQRFQSPVAEHRIAALPEALNQGQRGLDLVIRALEDESPQVQQAAYQLLQNRSEPKAKRAADTFYGTLHYSRLRNFLMVQDWEAADWETRSALSRAAGCDSPEAFKPNFIAAVPSRDFLMINRLWMRYSRGRFGFSVQKVVWEQCYNTFWEKTEIWRVFANRVGWRSTPLMGEGRWKRYGEITFGTHAPVGHLPFLGDNFGIFTVEAFANHLTTCLHWERQQNSSIQ